MLSPSLVRIGFLLGVLLLTIARAWAISPGIVGAGSSAAVCASADVCFQDAVSFADAHPGDVPGQIERFLRVRETHPGTPWAGRAGLRTGWALLDHDPAKALDYLRAARTDFPLLEDYAALKLGQALGRLGAWHDAAVMFDEALALSAPSVLRGETLYESGFAWFEDEQCGHAEDRLRRAASRHPTSRHAPRALHVRAICADRQQRAKDAVWALREIWRRHPGSPESHIVNDIVRSGRPASMRWEPSPEDYFRRAKTWYDQARFKNAIRDLQTFVDGRPGPGRDKGLFQLGMAHVRLKQYSKAAETFRRLAGAESAYTGKATVWLARVYLRRDQGRQLLALRNAETPALRVKDREQIRWLSGVWAEDHDHVQDALAAYDRVAQTAGLPDVRRRALWRAGWLRYQQGDWDDARDRFHTLASTAKDRDWRRRARYWHARALERMGREEEAQTGYRRVAAEWPMTYYGQLSQARLRHPVNVEENQRASWTAEAMALPASSAFLANAHIQKADALSLMGLCEEAVGELRAVGTRDDGAPRSVYAVAQRLMECGAHDAAILTAIRNFRDVLRRHRAPSDSPLWRAAYPAGYLKAIRDAAAPHVDPMLVAGLIREESLYDPKALSPVGAVGLMQLMPKTANRVARRLGLGAVDREALFGGALNVRLGTSHVGELLERYQGNPLFAIAAYNAGPVAAQRWIDKFGDRDPDEFVELISYKETRRYAKRVITSYRVYRYLYATPCSAFRLDRAC